MALWKVQGWCKYIKSPNKREMPTQMGKTLKTRRRSSKLSGTTMKLKRRKLNLCKIRVDITEGYHFGGGAKEGTRKRHPPIVGSKERTKRIVEINVVDEKIRLSQNQDLSSKHIKYQSINSTLFCLSK